jgi:Zn-dependent M28 family amino/carboxypeptidase
VAGRGPAGHPRGTAGRAGHQCRLPAHYDHLGVGIPDPAGDSIYNGFADNAAGVAMALGVGDAFARERRADRGLAHSLVLLFFTGEEQGLLGSDWFVAHPRWPLARIAGVINLDANAPAARPSSWRIAGEEGDPLVELVRRQTAERGWRLTLAQASPGSDYYPFARRGVPAVFFVPGDGPYEGLSLTASDSLRERCAELAAAVVWRLDRSDGGRMAADYRSSSRSATGPGGSR